MPLITLPHAAQLLSEDQLVAIPTETVYGLAANAGSALAVGKIFAAKGRPADHPLIVHVAHAAAAAAWAAQWSPTMQALAEAFWPGPLTLIVAKAAHVLPAVTGGQNSVGLRVPKHALALALLQEIHPMGLAAPSANRYGHISPTTAAHVANELGDELPLVDGGDCRVGIESTILDCTVAPHRILRPGAITPAQLAQVLGYVPEIWHKNKLPSAELAPRVSGDKDSHYAPSTATHLVEALSGRGVSIGFEHSDFVMSRDAQVYAHDLYATLRLADARC
ncbi:MAG: hypothetical protein RLZZ502_601, partial [Pseudomonadota bacterium]